MTPAETLLGRLDGVRELGQGRWAAKCPAHDDKRPSFHVQERPDGVLLVNCFGGCRTEDVLAAVGLSLSDLYPEDPHRQPYSRPSKARIPAADVLRLLSHEIVVCRILVHEFVQKRTLSAESWERLEAAGRRLDSAMGGGAGL